MFFYSVHGVPFYFILPCCILFSPFCRGFHGSGLGWVGLGWVGLGWVRFGLFGLIRFDSVWFGLFSVSISFPSNEN